MRRFSVSNKVLLIICLMYLIFLIDQTGSWTLPFAGSICLLLLGAGFAFRMHPDRPFEAAEREAS